MARLNCLCFLLLVLCASGVRAVDHAPATRPTVGLTNSTGPREAPRKVRTLRIDKPGVYENYLVDAEWADVDAVQIHADHVTLRNCEIRNARRDGIEVYGADVLIENCHIHHLLAGTFKEQKDAHGITGRPTRLTVRNCKIGYVSGDCLQFDPGRGPWTDVVIENCDLFAGPLAEDAAGFKKGQQPGENALDTKQKLANPRSKITVRNCLVHGFAKGGQIDNLAALNLKNHVEATVENCRFFDNEICLRLRGPGKGKELGGAIVTAIDCSFDQSDLAIRTEDQIERALIVRPRFEAGVKQQVRHVGGKPREFRITEESKAQE